MVLVMAFAFASAQDQPATPPAAGGAKANHLDGATLCGWCHEAGGRRAGKGPRLAGSPETDEFLANRIKTGTPRAMPAFGRAFTDDHIRAIAAHIRTLHAEPGP